jgi:hypothetical protein
MAKIRSYLVASHFGPTLLVTAVTFLLATQLWWEGPAYVIALGIFLGQLIVGWTNDLYDFRDRFLQSLLAKTCRRKRGHKIIHSRSKKAIMTDGCIVGCV